MGIDDIKYQLGNYVNVVITVWRSFGFNPVLNLLRLKIYGVIKMYLVGLVFKVR